MQATAKKSTEKVPVADPAKEAPVIDARTRRQIEKTIVHVNGLVTQAGEKLDAVADHLFETYFDGDVQRALGTAKDAPTGLLELAKEADGALRLSRPMLFHAIRVGALNRRLSRTAWVRLPWSSKTELLPLLGTELAFDRVSAGAAHAEKTKATVRELRAWVEEQRAQAEEEDPPAGVTTGPTFLAGRKALSVGASLGKAADRRRWVDRFLRLPSEEQAEYLAATRASARNFDKLANELASALDDG